MNMILVPNPATGSGTGLEARVTALESAGPGSVLTVDTAAAARALSNAQIDAARVVMTLGNATKADGGGAVWMPSSTSSAADNTGTVLVGVGGRRLLNLDFIQTNTVSVRAFGILPSLADNGANNGPLWNGAFRATSEFHGTLTLNAHPGSYWTDRPVDWWGSECEFKGIGAANQCRIKASNGDFSPIVDVKGVTSRDFGNNQRQSGNFTIEGTGVAYTGAPWNEHTQEGGQVGIRFDQGNAIYQRPNQFCYSGIAVRATSGPCVVFSRENVFLFNADYFDLSEPIGSVKNAVPWVSLRGDVNNNTMRGWRLSHAASNGGGFQYNGNVGARGAIHIADDGIFAAEHNVFDSWAFEGMWPTQGAAVFDVRANLHRFVNLQPTDGHGARGSITVNTNSTSTVTLTSGTVESLGLMVGNKVVGPGVQDGSTITSVGTTTFTLSLPATATAAGVSLSIYHTGTAFIRLRPVIAKTSTGNTNSTATVTLTGGNTCTSLGLHQGVGVAGAGIPGGATIATTGTSFTFSATTNATTTVTLTGGDTVASLGLAIGHVISGPGFQSGTTITAVGTTTFTVSKMTTVNMATPNTLKSLTNDTTFTISAPATATASGITVTFGTAPHYGANEITGGCWSGEEVDNSFAIDIQHNGNMVDAVRGFGGNCVRFGPGVSANHVTLSGSLSGAGGTSVTDDSGNTFNTVVDAARPPTTIALASDSFADRKAFTSLQKSGLAKTVTLPPPPVDSLVGWWDLGHGMATGYTAANATNGTAIDSILDLSGYGGTLLPIGGATARPVLATLGNLQGASFDGTDDLMRGLTGPPLVDGDMSGEVYFAAVVSRSNWGGYATIFMADNGTNGRVALGGYNLGGLEGYVQLVGSLKLPRQATVSAGIHFIECWNDGTRCVLAVDGVEVAVSSALYAAVGAWNRITFGGNGDGSQKGASIIGEVFFATRVPKNRADLRAFAQRKWGTP
jgi:hypothetical protein